MKPGPTILLASASPRRRDLLGAAGLEVVVMPAHIDETRQEGEHPVHLARRLARSKAEASRARAAQDRPELAALPVLAADTVVHARVPGQGPFAATIFEKPRDEAEAKAILAELSDRWHAVTTGYCLLHGERQLIEHVTTRVRFRSLTPKLIDLYVATGEPMDKAGAYGIQGRGAVLVARVEGSYTNVVGLPLEAVAAAIRRLGIGDTGR
jgi:septum formation protein